MYLRQELLHRFPPSILYHSWQQQFWRKVKEL
uniref:Uncharacterized protein n=1 Tax=Arundo donax TaxID=35708 RepID=A0A0A9C7D7_ARUDO